MHNYLTLSVNVLAKYEAQWRHTKACSNPSSEWLCQSPMQLRQMLRGWSPVPLWQHCE